MGEPLPLAWADPAAALRPSLQPASAGAHSAAAANEIAGDDGAADALALYARLLAANSVDSAAHALVAALATSGRLSRVSFALHERGRTRLLASTNLDLSNPLADLPQRLLGAACEAIEQGLVLAWPLSEGDFGAADPIRVEHQALQRLVGGAVATIPLGSRGESYAALCLERHDGPAFGVDELARLTDITLLAAPALRWMQHGTERWHRRLARDIGAGIAALRQPSRRTTRRLIGAGALLLLWLALAPLEFEVSGRARIEGGEQRILSAPTDGFVKLAHARPGDRVRAGAPLVDLLEEDLRLERERWTSQLAQHENAYAAAMARSERVAAATSMERVAEAQAQLALVDEQLTRGRIVAPFDAMVIEGDLSQSIGAPVRQGDKLLTLATTDVFRVIADIDELDIGRVAVGQAGELALSSLPWDSHAIVVERIAPIARAVDGRNIFEVEARLLQPPPELRPGLLGRAELVVGRRPPLWVWTGQALDRIRLAWWKWIG